MKKILLIAYGYPPLEDAQSLRWYYVSGELAKLGFLIDVITIKHPEALKQTIHKNIKIHRVYTGFFENIAYKVKNKMGVDDAKNQEQRKSNLFGFMKKGYWLVRSLADTILPGNITSEWYPHAKKYIKENININVYDYMITSHEPWVDSLLGYWIKKQYPDLFWIADFADPYVSIYTPKHKLFFENKIEKKLYSKVDLMLLTNEKVQERLTEKYPFLQDKDILVLEQGFAKREHIKTQNDTFTIVYTGTFYEEFRNPKELSDALMELNFEFRFIVAGRNEKFNDIFEPLGDKYKFLGFVSHQDILKLQDSSDVLVHLSNKQIEQVPGKFFEYLGADKPMLVIYQDERDQLIDFCEEIGIKSICKNEKQSIKDKLTDMYNNQTHNYDNDEIMKYSWENRALKLKERLV